LNFPEKISNLVVKMLNPDPELRINMAEINNNEWFLEMEKLAY